METAALAMSAPHILVCVQPEVEKRIRAAIDARVVAYAVGPAETLQSLRAPPLPALIILAADHIQDLTPARLARIRRAPNAAVRKLPIMALTNTSAEAAAWSAAGAFTVPLGASRGTLHKVIRHAMDAEVRWVETAAYVGPCRRTHRAILRRAARRLEDSPMLAKTRPRPRKEPREETFAVMAASVDGGQPLPTVLRRLRISNNGLCHSDRDQRARFLSDVRLARAQASRSTNYALVRELASLESEIVAAGSVGPLDPAAIDTKLYDALRALGEA